MIIHGPEGTWTFEHQHDSNTNIVRKLRVRFIDREGEEYRDLEGVAKFLVSLSFPLWRVPTSPSLGGWGTLLIEILPPPALSLAAFPVLSLWRMSEVREWLEREVRI